jgi:platelet-activating factor acetylhydrolase
LSAASCPGRRQKHLTDRRIRAFAIYTTQIRPYSSPTEGTPHLWVNKMAAPAATTTEKMSSYLSRSYLSRLSPIPSFQEYSGPYKVGTIDMEIPVAELDAPSPAPANAEAIQTVQFRVFYPAEPDSNGRRISWLPAPQRLHVSAYTQFLGFGPMFASVLSFLPRHLHYTSIPVHKNAKLLSPSDGKHDGRWPTMIFSHGLGGSRNAYSHLAGSLASHGVIVLCPEHRDGSSVISFVRDPEAQSRFFLRGTRRVVPYHRIPHTQSAEVWDARTAQMKIRLWELGLVHEAVLAIDSGLAMKNLNLSTPTACVEQFEGKMRVHEPGSIIFAGHSFGAATMVQFLKSTYYADVPAVASMSDPLFTPRADAAIRRQVTERNTTILLDMWCFPLLSAASAPLFELPLPIYADVPSARGGAALLAVESEAFYKWTEHLHVTARILSPEPSAAVVEPRAWERPESGVRLPEPNFFYVQNSAHLSQSDFGVLFPWLTKRVFGAEQPERALRLNLRALLQHLRSNGVPVARTWVGDLVEGTHVSKMDVGVGSDGAGEAGSADSAPLNLAKFGNKGLEDGIHDDKAIFDRGGHNAVEAWNWIDIVGMGAESASCEAELQSEDASSETHSVDGEDTERHMEGEMEPHLAGENEVVNDSLQAVAAAA